VSPVSRKRKKKGKKKSDGLSAPALAPVMPWTSFDERPPFWFAPAIMRVLAGADGLPSAERTRELEQATAELLGAQLRGALESSPDDLQLDWWLRDLAAAAANREAFGGLLRGLNLLGSSADITATGEVWEMRDRSRTRIAVIMGLSYGGDPAVYLFDIDACGWADLAGGGVFDDVEQAAAAWREAVGEAAADSRPTPVESRDRLLPLAHCNLGDETLIRSGSRNRMDNWYRAQARYADLLDVLEQRGIRLLPVPDLYRNLEPGPMVEAFLAWHTGPADREVVAALAEQWQEGILPDTWYRTSPHRVDHFNAVLDEEWIADDPFTLETKALLPDWVRWLEERS
jgi:hypothetical protein